MGLLTIKKIAFATFVGMVVMLAANSEVSAQSRREIERQRIEQQNARNHRDYRNTTRTNRRAEQRIANSTYATGYEQGMLAGKFDRRKGKYNRSNVYRDTGAYPNEGDPTSTDYIYRQAYLQGYNDGFNGIRNY